MSCSCLACIFLLFSCFGLVFVSLPCFASSCFLVIVVVLSCLVFFVLSCFFSSRLVLSFVVLVFSCDDLCDLLCFFIKYCTLLWCFFFSLSSNRFHVSYPFVYKPRTVLAGLVSLEQHILMSHYAHPAQAAWPVSNTLLLEAKAAEKPTLL